ncbi:hypothetical protein C8F04DRAFT_237040 [Mycena alexandri]|uniref:Zn(2)-C6 fungal-type domain-containing protein n=1 Tax=Mycena alexandri TaxID=1745969 RepID=A0AAD6S8P7_9AGAR|nr:hypothetical protein C8F04DRAFT_237040 [Mycena alexandri]
MSDPFALPKKTTLACKECRSRKQKCMTDSQDTPCMRCWQNGLVCEYLHTEKQKARLSGTNHGGSDRSLAGGHSSALQSPPPQSNHAPYPAYGQHPSYGAGYANSSNTPAIPRSNYVPSVPPLSGGNPHGGGSNNFESRYRPANHGSNNTYPTYQVAAQAPAPAPPSHSTQSYMIPGMYPGPNPPPQSMSPGYPASSSANFGYHGNTSTTTSQFQPCICSPSGPCYCGRRY